MLVRSLGRLSTQTLSSLSTASPVTPPSFHLFGRGFGQSGSNLSFGAVRVCAPSKAQKKITLMPETRRVSLVFLRFILTPIQAVYFAVFASFFRKSSKL